jgi:hypothetical protein
MACVVCGARYQDRCKFWLRTVWKHGQSFSDEQLDGIACCMFYEEIKPGQLVRSEPAHFQEEVIQRR